MRTTFIGAAGMSLAALLASACNDKTVTTGGNLEPDGGGVTPGDDGGASQVPDAPTTGGDVPDAPTTTGGPPDAPIGPPPPEVTWGAESGLTGPILDVSTDDAGNVWAIRTDTLYVKTPSATSFAAFGNADGLHVEPFTAVDGSAAVTTLTAVAGARANELYLGYYGYEGSTDPSSDTDAQKALGNGDHITFDPASGRITVLRYQFKCVVESFHCWEDRSVRRIVVGHSGVAAGHAFFGFNHGTTHVWNDVLGDHVHPEVIWVNGTTTLTHYGECQALALNDDGTLWIGNHWGFGLMNWNPDPIAWTTAKFKFAYTTYTADHSLEVPWGYAEDNRAAGVTPDGTMWLASYSNGLSSWNPTTSITTMRHWSGTPGVPTDSIVDLVADTDGTLWMIVHGALLHMDPATGAITASAIQDAHRMYIDKTTNPRGLYIARESGVTVMH